MRLFHPTTLTVRLALLFAVVAIFTFAGVGTYLYRSLVVQLEARDDQELIGKVEQFRHILRDTPSTHSIKEDPHRFDDVAAGHDGLITILRTSDGVTLARSQEEIYDFVNMPVVPPDEYPQLVFLRDWTYAPDKKARTISAWGRLNNSTELVQIIVARTGSERMVLLQEYRREVLGATIIGAMMAALLGYMVVRQSIAPVKSIAQQAHSITAQRLDKRLDAQKVPKELQALVQSFNSALDRLQESFQRLSQFSADLAHDLRTPLYNLTMQTQVALSKQRTNEEYQVLMSSSLEEYDRLTRMVESMLFLARADNAQVALNRQHFDVAEELCRVVEYFKGLAEECNSQCIVQGEAVLFADTVLFRRAVSNLAANAIQYSPPGSTITFATDQIDNEVVVSITNPGPGIEASHLTHLFDRFYRIDQARSQPTSSAGLGLAIVQSIMKLHGGKVEVTSVPGKDTTFKLHFPFVRI